MNYTELMALMLVTEHEWKIEELQGRVSGDKEWKVGNLFTSYPNPRS